jgi:uncharacterized protein (UPF0264 family)
LIDVKEPSRGSLGLADPAVIGRIVACVAGRRPVSAAQGELLDGAPAPDTPGLSHVKWGLAGCRGQSWQRILKQAGRRMRETAPRCLPVAVAYADWQRAHAPLPEEVGAFAIEVGWSVLLIDTWQKDGASLLDWLEPSRLGGLCRRCREAGVQVALAGSLGFDHLPVVRSLKPDWLAVRGAVCCQGQRNGVIDPSAVRRLVEALRASNGES